MPKKKIGVLTGGGDCPGLNAVIRAVTKSAILAHNYEVVGFEDGFDGLVLNRSIALDYEAASGILAQGGTILGSSNKANPFKYYREKEDGTLVAEDRTADVLETYKAHGLEALVCIGGDGTLTIADGFRQLGLNVVGIPKTIDNDIYGTERTFGFDTAVGIVTEALDRIHTTAMSHHRVMVVEVMGRNAGWLALHAGVAGGGDIILLPEIPYDMAAIYRRVEMRGGIGKRFSIVVIAEGAKAQGGEQVVDRVVEDSHERLRLGGVGKVVGDAIEDHTGLETRVTVLGHLQRGGSPSAYDRVLCTELGNYAMQLVADGGYGQFVAVEGSSLVAKPLSVPAGKQRTVPLDHPLIQAAREVGTSFGDEVLEA